MNKKILSSALVLVLIFTLSTQGIFAQQNGHSKKDKNEKNHPAQVTETDENYVDENDLAYDLKLMLSYGTEGWTNLPHGLSKRDELPPGLKKLNLQNRLPHGLAKRIEGYEKPEYNLLEKLSEMIDNARTLLETKEEILYTEVGIDSFNESILTAESFFENYVETEDEAILEVIKTLKEAMKTFKLQEVLGEDAYNTLEELYNAMVIYGDLYFENLEAIDEKDEFYNEYKDLMTSLEAILVENSDVILTKELFNELIKTSKVFKNHKIVLEMLIVNAKELLFVNLEDEVLVFKYNEGTEPGNVVLGSNAMLFESIKKAEEALEALDAYDYQDLKLEEEALLTSMEIFKNKIFLGEPAIQTLLNIEVLLEERYANEPVEALNILIEKIKVYTSEENKNITTGDFNLILTESKDYIDALFIGMEDAIETLISENQAVLDKVIIDDGLDLTSYEAAVIGAEMYLSSEGSWTFDSLNQTYALLVEHWELIVDEASGLLETLVGDISFAILDHNDVALDELRLLSDEVIDYLVQVDKEMITLQGINDYYMNLNALYTAYEDSISSETSGE